MRFVGALIIWLSFAFAGYCASRRFRLRKELYSGLVLLTENLVNEIRYFVRPIADSILMNSSNIDKCYIDILIRNMNEGYDFPVAWQLTVKEAELPLTVFEKNKISDMMINLGKSDAEIQINILNSYRTYFIKMTEKAELNNIKYSASIFVSSVLLGGAVFLILI